MNARSVPFLRFAGFAFAAAVFCSSPALAQAEPGNFPNQVGPGLYRLDGHDPSLPLGDLAPLSRIVGNARFVGLGEPLHTSGGIYELKGRVLRHLVEHEGFRVLAWESPFFGVEPLEAFLQRCDQPAAEFLTQNRVIFNVFRSTETAEILQWMCDWNQSHPKAKDKLHTYGFDIQSQALPAANALINYLTEVGLAAEDPRVAGIRLCDGVAETFFPARPFPAERYGQCQDALAAVATFFDENEISLVQTTSREALALARIYRVIEESWQGQRFATAAGDFLTLYRFRDRGMAYLAEALRELRYPHERVMLWAHNAHVIKAGRSYVGTEAMGDFLDQSLGDDYRALGLVASEINANWPQVGLCGVVSQRVPGFPQVEDLLAGVGEGALIADLDPRGSHGSFIDPNAVHAVADSTVVPAQGFDALLYLPVSPAMHPLPGVPRCP